MSSLITFPSRPRDNFCAKDILIKTFNELPKFRAMQQMTFDEYVTTVFRLVPYDNRVAALRALVYRQKIITLPMVVSLNGCSSVMKKCSMLGHPLNDIH